MARQDVPQRDIGKARRVPRNHRRTLHAGRTACTRGRVGAICVVRRDAAYPSTVTPDVLKPLGMLDPMALPTAVSASLRSAEMIQVPRVAAHVHPPLHTDRTSH